MFEPELFVPPSTCSYLQEAACELTENNILAHDRFTDTPGACQELCRQEEGCTWFTHFENNCYMLDHCGELATFVSVSVGLGVIIVAV